MPTLDVTYYGLLQTHLLCISHGVFPDAWVDDARTLRQLFAMQALAELEQELLALHRC